MAADSTPVIKEFAPFAYFVDQSSVLPGLGGSRQSPDPRYCFHTEYEELAPGIVNFMIQLGDARATYGEMTVRIHAYRPNSGLDVTLASSTQFALQNLNGESAEIRLRVAAIPGVHYAAYGYLSEPSDLTCTRIQVFAEQLGGESADSYAASELGHTAFGAGPTIALKLIVGDSVPNLSTPQSQPITSAQLASMGFSDLAEEISNQTDLWRKTFALRAIEHFKFLQPGARGLLINDAGQLAGQLREAGCQVICHDPSRDGSTTDPVGNWVGGPLQELAGAVSHVDFVLALGTLDRVTSYAELIDTLNAVLRCLLRGGVAVFLFNYWPDRAEPSEHGRFVITETVIRRIALHVIGHESSIVQLLIPKPEPALFDPEKGLAFGLIAFR